MRAVVVTGAGRGFCAGQDLTEFQGRAPRSVRDALERTYHPNIRAHPRAREARDCRRQRAGGGRRALARAAPATSGSPARRRASFPASSASASCRTRAARGSSTAARLARAFEWMTTNRRLDRRGGAAWGLVSRGRRPTRLGGRVAEVAATSPRCRRARSGDEAAVRARGQRRRSRSSSRSRPSSEAAPDGRLRRGRRRVPREAAPSFTGS